MARDLKIEHVAVSDLVPYARNPRSHSNEQVEVIAASIERFGWTNPVLIGNDSDIIAGHGRLMAAKRLGLKVVPVLRIGDLSPDERRAYVIADNQTGLRAGWDLDLLRLELTELKGLDFNLGPIGFDDAELAAILDTRPTGLIDPDAAPEPPANPVATRGDLWALGRHRILCGDATLAGDVERLRGGVAIDLILTDPPYCSGGWQESGRAGGSVGTDAPHKQIANDRLSSRGYSQLLKTAFSEMDAPFLYAFTDWRMWTFLFDVAESSGFGARSMIVWDKGTPGMGKGWRAQHELIMWAAKIVAPFEYVGGRGNVLQHARTGNVLHTTEKPAELIADLLKIAEFAKIVADPFVGSGTTIIAAEMTGRACYALEIDPAYVDVAITRWQSFTGEHATLNGKTFEQVKSERGKG
jgi:DNA modification methylase